MVGVFWATAVNVVIDGTTINYCLKKRNRGCVLISGHFVSRMRRIEEFGQAPDANVALIHVPGHDSNQPPRGSVTQQLGTFGIPTSANIGRSAPGSERCRPSRNGPQ